MASDDKGEDEDDTASAAIRKAARLTAFIVGTTINDCLVNSASGKLLLIKGMEASKLTCKMLRTFCSVHSITGYKGLNKLKMCDLIVERCRSKAVATSYYPEDNEGDEEGDEDDDEDDDDEETDPAFNREESAIPENTFEWDDEAGVGVVTTEAGVSNNGADVQTGTANGRAATPTNVTAPVANGRKARKAKPKALKSSAPKVITKEGTYYRVLNVYFDERHRPDVLRMGAISTRNELDAREFKNKRIYDALVITYLDRETDPCDNGQMSYPDDPFFGALGIGNETPDD